MVWHGIGDQALETKFVRAQRIMKSESKLLVMVALSAWMAVASALAQTNPTTTTPTEGTRVGKVVEPSPLTPQDSVTAVVRPKLTERPDLPPEVLVRIERFKREAQAYLDQQQALKKLLQGANDQERARIRDQMRALREQWLERAR